MELHTSYLQNVKHNLHMPVKGYIRQRFTLHFRSNSYGLLFPRIIKIPLRHVGMGINDPADFPELEYTRSIQMFTPLIDGLMKDVLLKCKSILRL
ncbi:hypothetical protein GJ496_006591 [Pomphorhynchus laevis]|nr:hypothetical protein GJ496_006591 [Pomphorhynchus laevis]